MSRDMTTLDLGELRGLVDEQPYPVLFATVSGAHLYGFPSRDSDVDLRGSHLLPAAEVVGLRTGPATLSRAWTHAGAEIDLVTADAHKFFGMLLKRNGYVLEQVTSPIVVASGEVHEELRALAPRCVTFRHAHHYLGFARGQWQLFASNGELKPLLYTLRVLASGIHLMRSGEIQAHLPSLAEVVPEVPAYVGDLVAAKIAGEHLAFEEADGAPDRNRLADDVAALRATLEDAAERTSLPAYADTEPELHDLLVRLRLSSPAASAPGSAPASAPAVAHESAATLAGTG